MDALHDIRFTIALAHDEGLPEHTFLDGNPDIVGHRKGTLVERSLLDLPSRPTCRTAVVEHHQADALPRCH